MSKQNSFESQGNTAIKEAEKKANSALMAGVTSIVHGIPRLRRLVNLIWFLALCLVAATAYFFKGSIFALFDNLVDSPAPVWVRYIVWVVLLVLPLLYLGTLGGKTDESENQYLTAFKEIGFKGKDGKYPVLLSEKEENKKTVYRFKSNIPLQEWRKAKPRIETAFNCSILNFENDSNKKIVIITSIASDKEIPKMINWSDDFLLEEGMIVLGEDAIAPVTFNLNRTPHVLIAGETGSGKSVVLRSCLWQMIKQGSSVYMLDFKGGVEFGKKYEKYGEVITERNRAVEVLTELCEENMQRLALFRELEVKNLSEYNLKSGSNLCRIGVFCDEIAEMLDKKGVNKEDKPVYDQLDAKFSTLARLSRATGINLFMGAQRPDANVLTGQIKINLPVRICGRFADKTTSEIVLGNTRATELPDTKGRFLFKVGNEITEFQSYYFDDETMFSIDFDRQQNLHTMLSGKKAAQPKNISPEYAKVVPPLGSSENLKLDLNFGKEEE